MTQREYYYSSRIVYLWDNVMKADFNSKREAMNIVIRPFTLISKLIKN